MDQLHKRLTPEQIKVLLQGYCQGTIGRASVEETLGIGKTRFFALLKEYLGIQRGFPLLTSERLQPGVANLAPDGGRFLPKYAPNNLTLASKSVILQ